MRDDPDGYAGSFSNPGFEFGGMTGRRQPPPQPLEIHNVEAEAALLGALMIDNKLLDMAAENLAADDFYEPVHGRIFKAMLRLHSRGINANPVYLRPIFQNDPDIPRLGGVGYLATLTGSGAALVGARDFAQQIVDMAARRRVAAAATEALERLGDLTDEAAVMDVDDIIAELQDKSYEAVKRSEPVKPQSSSSLIRAVLERHDRIISTGEAIGATCISVDDINKIIGPAEGGTLNVIGGRPGMGKTALAESIAWGYAAGGTPVDYYLAEMTKDQIGMRHASDLSHAMGIPIPHAKIRKNDLSDRELDWLEQVEKAAALLPLNFIPTGVVDIRRVETAAARSKRRWEARGRKLGVVIVDYMQLYQATDARGRPITNDTERVNVISRRLKDLSERLDVAVFALSALGRAVEERKDKRPQMNDLKQSGNIEQDADSVTFVYRGEVYWAKEKPKGDETTKEYQDWALEMNALSGIMELICEKNRHGPPRTRAVKYIARHFAVRGGDFDEMADPLFQANLFAGEDDDVSFN